MSSVPMLHLVGALSGPMAQLWVPPFTWQLVLSRALKVILIVGIAFLLLEITERITRSWIERVADLPASDPKRQRVVTLGNLLKSVAGYAVWAVAGIMVLGEIGLDVGALIATAGIAGLAIGFGAQTLVKDLIAGIFLLFDDVIHVGDLVSISGHTGTVESIGVRLIKLRKFDGELVMIPAGEVRTFGNKSVQWARAVVSVGLSYEQDVDAIVPVIQRVANQWAEENEEILLEDQPQVQGIMEFGDSSVTARVSVQVKPGEQFAAERELRRRLKRAFDEQDIEIPFPQRTAHIVQEASSPPRTPSDRDSEEPSLNAEGSD